MKTICEFTSTLAQIEHPLATVTLVTNAVATFLPRMSPPHQPRSDYKFSDSTRVARMAYAILFLKLICDPKTSDS